MAVRIDRVRSFKKRGSTLDYLVVDVTDAENLNWEFSAWDTKHHQYIQDGLGGMMVGEFSESVKADRKYTNLEHILEMGAVKFVDDAPVDADTEF